MLHPRRPPSSLGSPWRLHVSYCSPQSSWPSKLLRTWMPVSGTGILTRAWHTLLLRGSLPQILSLSSGVQSRWTSCMRHSRPSTLAILERLSCVSTRGRPSTQKCVCVLYANPPPSPHFFTHHHERTQDTFTPHHKSCQDGEKGVQVQEPVSVSVSVSIPGHPGVFLPNQKPVQIPVQVQAVFGRSGWPSPDRGIGVQYHWAQCVQGAARAP